MHFHDLIFPLFLFIMGVTFPFWMGRRTETGKSRGSIACRVVVRAAALVFLGWVYYGLFELKGIEHQRMLGVLQRLGIAWGIAALIAVYTTVRGQVAATRALLIGYSLAMRHLPVPGFAAGTLTPEGTFAHYIDRLVFLPGQLYEKYGDPEGKFSTIPAIATALLGILTGQWPRSSDSPSKKAQIMAASGVACMALGWLWGLQYPSSSLYFNDSTGVGDQGEKDATGPWNTKGVQIVEAPAFQELTLSSKGKSNGGSGAARSGKRIWAVDKRASGHISALVRRRGTRVWSRQGRATTTGRPPLPAPLVSGLCKRESPIGRSPVRCQCISPGGMLRSSPVCRNQSRS